jgi:hypothetical protein
VTTRTTRSRVTFDAPFLIRGIHGPVPAGTYDLEVEEVVIEGITHAAWHRVTTILYRSTGGMTVSHVIDPADLAAALALDAGAQATAGLSPRRVGH